MRNEAWLSQDGTQQIGPLFGFGPFLLRRRMQKMRIVGGSLALGFSGPTLLARWLHCQAIAFGCQSLDQLEAAMPDIWHRMPQRGRSVALVMNAIGWSDRRERMAGLTFYSGDDMAPDECLDAESVNVDIGTATADAVERAGRDICVRHRLIGIDAARQSRAGTLPNRACISGILRTLRCTRDRAEIVQAYDLDAPLA